MGSKGGFINKVDTIFTFFSPSFFIIFSCRNSPNPIVHTACSARNVQCPVRPALAWSTARRPAGNALSLIFLETEKITIFLINFCKLWFVQLHGTVSSLPFLLAPGRQVEIIWAHKIPLPPPSLWDRRAIKPNHNSYMTGSALTPMEAPL